MSPRLQRWTLLLLASLACLGCEGEQKGQRRGRAPAAAPAVAVAATAVEPVEERLLGHAALEAEANVEVSTRVEGRVVELVAEAGDDVAAGAVLAVLDPTRAELAHREAQLALRQAKSALARTDQIFRQGVGSAEELEQAKTALKQAELSLEQATLDLSETKLRSPLGGVVTERLVAKGQTIRPGEVAFRIADRVPLLAKVRIPEAQAERVRVGQQARVTLEGRPQPLPGEVVRVAPLVDLESGTVIVTVSLSEGIEDLRLNRFATVEVVVERRERALTIPLDALAVRGREDRVLVCVSGPPPVKPGAGMGGAGKGPGKGGPGQGGPGGKGGPGGPGKGGPGKGGPGQSAPQTSHHVVLRRIRTGVRQGGRIEVLEGLQEGEQVVIAAPDDLRSGAGVRVVDAEGQRAPSAAPPTSAARVGSPTRGR